MKYGYNDIKTLTERVGKIRTIQRTGVAEIRYKQDDLKLAPELHIERAGTIIV